MISSQSTGDSAGVVDTVAVDILKHERVLVLSKYVTSFTCSSIVDSNRKALWEAHWSIFVLTCHTLMVHWQSREQTLPKVLNLGSNMSHFLFQDIVLEFVKQRTLTRTMLLNDASRN